MKLNLILNGDDVTLSGSPLETLFSVLQREKKYFEQNVCCGKGTCGHCTVLLDSREVPSCLIPFYQVQQKEIVTPEGFFATEDYRFLRKVLEEEGLVFCSQCTNARIFHICAFLEQFPGAQEEEWKGILNEIPCRCGSLDVMTKAVKRYAARKESGRERS